MCIAFEDGVLKDDAWNGYIWLYLPVNIKRAKIFYQLLGKVEVHGTAWGGKSSEIDNEHLQIVDYVEETSCRAAGYIYRLKVSSSRYNESQREIEQRKLQEALEKMRRRPSATKRTRSGYISATSTIDEADSREERGESLEVAEEKLVVDAVSVEEVAGESGHPSLSMSATFDNIGLQGLLPRPLRTKFDQNDPGIILTRPASFLTSNPLSKGTSSPKYSSPSKPLRISSVADLKHSSKEFVDYLMISWISDMEESVSRVDSPNDLFS